MTMCYDTRKDKLRLFSHHREIDYNEPSIAQQSYQAAKSQGIVDFCIANPDITVQYELTGPNIQRKITKDYVCHVFAVWDRKTMHKFTYQEMWTRALRDDSSWRIITHSHVPLVHSLRLSDCEKVSDILDAVENIRGYVAEGQLDEGVVFHITGQGDLTDSEWTYVRNRLAPTMEFKAVSNKYLLKEK